MNFTKTETIRFKHVDFAGIVFYPRFLEMLNDLVEDWFDEALDRPFAKIHEQNVGIPTVDLKVQFKKPARIGEQLTKHLWVIELGGASVVCGFRFADQTDQICLQGEVTLVNVAIDKQTDSIKAQPFDDQTRSKILPYQVFKT